VTLDDEHADGAWESAQQGLAEARAGLGTELDDL
jgi:hypothetical protein